jgi:nuclear pore complex protein Nup205
MTFDASTFGQGRASDIANDRLYQLFRSSLRCVQLPVATARLREDYYNVAFQYLKGMSDVTAETELVGLHGTQTIKASGDRLLEVICNDAYSAEGTCRIIAILLLESLVELSTSEGSTYVIDALVRQNFLVLLIDTIKTIGYDLQHTRSEGLLFPSNSATVMLTYVRRPFVIEVFSGCDGVPAQTITY